jgi:peptidoglycan/LPS O-acetylase OafA/YrhL
MEKRIYFKNLNGLRFVAATAVIFHHVEQYKFWAKFPSIWGNATNDALGQKAVSFFFVLSGFLISFLLLEENRKTSNIRIRDFYIRRILRIWPVYYLVIILCLFIVPNVIDLSFLGINMFDSKFELKAVFLLLVLPNLLRIYSPSIVGGNQLWSIGVEEQFYLIWPFLVKRFLQKFLHFLIVFIILKLLVTVGLELMVLSRGGLFLSSLYRFWILLKIEQMAIGAIGAWILFNHKEKILKAIYHWITWIICLVALGALLTIPFHHWIVNYFEAIVFLLIILNLSTNPAIRFSMEYPLLARLGNISYGIYMYHTLCITVCIYTLMYFGVHEKNYVLFNCLLYAGSVFLTLAVAHISYEYFEKYFLNLKEKFMIVKSGQESALSETQSARTKKDVL